VREVLPDTPVIFDTVDLHFLREERRALLGDAGGKPKAALATRELELALIRSSDATAVVSDYEAQLLSAIVPDAAVRVLSNVHDGIPSDELAPDPQDIVFVGSFQHDPNLDAVRWLVTEIFPLVLRERPDARLVVVGRNPPADLVATSPQSVRFLGWVDDLAAVHARTAVSVAPLRYGAGVKGKVGDAWAHGLAVVMTRLAAEGMHVEDGVHALVADDSAGFAEAIVAILRDDDLRRRLGDAARRHVEERFGTARVRESLAEVLQAAGARQPRRAREQGVVP
jgi:glycosyltransferase involved in cell wall biosynthesis